MFSNLKFNFYFSNLIKVSVDFVLQAETSAAQAQSKPSEPIATQEVSTDMVDIAVATEPECLGPCEPGTHVNLEGIVWHESENGEFQLLGMSVYVFASGVPLVSFNIHLFIMMMYGCGRELNAHFSDAASLNCD